MKIGTVNKVNENDIFAVLEQPGSSTDVITETAVEQLSKSGSLAKPSAPLPMAQDLFKQKQFFRRLCYAPVWKLDTITNPSELIFAAELESNFLLKLETGIHRLFQDSLKDYVTLRIFDLEKRVELKQIAQVKHREAFFGDVSDQRKFVGFVDSLPLYFAIRPVCSHCNVTFDLINPLNRNDVPFWAHSTRKPNNGEAQAETRCRHSQSLWGEFPNLDNR